MYQVGNIWKYLEIFASNILSEMYQVGNICSDLKFLLMRDLPDLKYLLMWDVPDLKYLLLWDLPDEIFVHFLRDKCSAWDLAINQITPIASFSAHENLPAVVASFSEELSAVSSSWSEKKSADETNNPVLEKEPASLLTAVDFSWACPNTTYQCRKPQEPPPSLLLTLMPQQSWLRFSSSSSWLRLF